MELLMQDKLSRKNLICIRDVETVMVRICHHIRREACSTRSRDRREEKKWIAMGLASPRGQVRDDKFYFTGV